MQTKLSLLLLFSLLATGAAAAEVKPVRACQGLMTEKECDDHLTMLATLAPGEALDRYMREYTRVQQERRLACNCLSTPVGWAKMPKQRQALLRF